MLKLKSPVRASELILPLVKRGYPGCRQESRTRIPAARSRDVRKTGQFGQECGDDLDLDYGLEISLGGDIGQPENWFLPWNVATSVVGGNRNLVVLIGVNIRELQFYEYIWGQIELERTNYRKAADLLGKACSRLFLEAVCAAEQAPYFDTLARALYDSGDLNKARQEHVFVPSLAVY